ncbi:DUF3560 domain-containing protein, partial [Xenorhabdus sp. SGI246]|uniref:DUF3560 domain-containing protein n=1 Tax=Xenorhabdus sp. SGI246 TaxID=3158263 RepID=UPI00349F9127
MNDSQKWQETEFAALMTSTGFKLQHIEGNNVCCSEHVYIVGEKGGLFKDGICQIKLGKVASALVQVTEKLRIGWLNKMAKGDESNAYELYQQARKERYSELADKARNQGRAALKQARDIMSFIPPGQPILVGHHSERRHRRDLEKIERLERKAYSECEGKASYYETKAENVGNGGVSGDDPDAVWKLTQELKELIANQELMKSCNKVIKKYSDEEKRKNELKILGLTDKKIHHLLYQGLGGWVGFEPFKLTNNNARIKRVIRRINEIKTIKE